MPTKNISSYIVPSSCFLVFHTYTVGIYSLQIIAKRYVLCSYKSPIV
nr:MAG TPA: hypothetical protein [Caudoviricetes sp.]DAS88505.1 MAG TPA: hypothetical protein [Bacteriophage sp.]